MYPIKEILRTAPAGVEISKSPLASLMDPPMSSPAERTEIVAPGIALPATSVTLPLIFTCCPKPSILKRRNITRRRWCIEYLGFFMKNGCMIQANRA
jgi:hypothetical protein